MPEASSGIRFHDYPLPGVEAMSAHTSRSFPRHTHDEFGIGLVDAGGHASWSDRGRVEAGPGHFISVNPGEVHDGNAIGGQARSWRILYLQPLLLQELLAEIGDGQSEPRLVAPVFADASLRAAFERAFRRASCRGADAAMATEADLLALAAGLLPHSTLRPEPAGALPSIRRARERIDRDPAARVSLGELAREASMSRFQLLRGFARDTGLTPHAYLMQRRVALARRLLRSGQEPSDVALQAGFCDQSHLTRCFTRLVGVPPLRFARRR